MTEAMTDYLAIWEQAARAGDADLLGEALAEDAELISPLTEAFTFQGRAEIVELMHSVFEVLSGMEITDRFDKPGRTVLVLSATIRGTRLDETQLLDLDDEGRIARITLHLRPLPAVAGLLRELGSRVPRRQGRPGAARVLAAAGFLLDSVAATGEKVFLPMAAPRRVER